MLNRGVSQGVLVNFTEPEEESADIRIAPQITSVLRVDKRAVVFSVEEGTIVNWVSLQIVVGQAVKHPASSSLIEQIDERSALGREVNAAVIPDSCE